MAIVSTTELSDRLGATLYARLTDRINGSVADNVVGQRSIDEAEAEIESYLARRFTTPIDLAADPGFETIIKARTLDLAEHRLWQGSPFVSDVPTRVEMLRTTALRWLESVASGVVRLPTETPIAHSGDNPDTPRYRSAPRTLTQAELDGL